MSDFLSSSGSSPTTAQANRPCPPVISPSPSPEGMRIPSDTEPFPAFDAESDPTPVEGPHCIRHCHHDICNWLIRKRKLNSRCQCSSYPPAAPVALASPNPEPTLSTTTLKTLHATGKHAITTPNNTLTINLLDMRILLSQLQPHTHTRALTMTPLVQNLEYIFPGEVPAGIKYIIKIFFNDMRTYLKRTLLSTGTRVLRISDLRAELEVYLWTMMRYLMARVCNAATLNRVRGDDPRSFISGVMIGPLDKVAVFWRACTDEVVGLAVWRDEQVRRCEETEAAAKKGDAWTAKKQDSTPSLVREAMG